MSAYWLTFRPKEESKDRGWPLASLRDLIARVEANPDAPEAVERWRMHSHVQARVGDRVYVFKQGNASPRGIIGVGEIVTMADERATPTDSDIRWRVGVRFQKLVDPTVRFLLPLDAIEDFVPVSLVNAAASGFSVPDDVAGELERRLAPILMAGTPAIGSDQADDPAFDPCSARDERERAMRAICIRRGQPAFRKALMTAYGGRCAVTGCDVEDVLEAAHISPYSGTSSDHVTNGLLLRADIHTLLDCGLLAVDPSTREVVLTGSDYAHLTGKKLREPATPGDRPDRLYLRQRLAELELAGR